MGKGRDRAFLHPAPLVTGKHINGGGGGGGGKLISGGLIIG